MTGRHAAPRVTVAEARKTVVTVVAALGELVAAGALDGKPLLIATAILGAATTLGVYHVPNKK